MEKRGQPIVGSRFYRDFCARCREPMRVTQLRIEEKIPSWCEDCNPKHIGVGNGVTARIDDDTDAFLPKWRSA